VYHVSSGTVGPGSAGAVYLHCSGAARYGISGLFVPGTPTAAGQLALGISAPVRHGWSVGVVNFSSTTEPFFGGGVCSSRRFTFRDAVIQLGPGQTDGLTAPCRGRYPKPLSGISFPSNGNPGNVILGESAPRGHTWVTVLKNLGAQPVTYVVGAFCGPRTLHVVDLATNVETIPPNQTSGGKGRCPRAAPHAISGFFSPSGQTTWGQIGLAGSSPFGRSNRQWVDVLANLTGQAQRAVSGTICIG
jgi:hypothetical protein